MKNRELEVLLNIGDKLYKNTPLNGIFEYIVTEIRQDKDNVMYVAECQQCNHGYNCLVLIARNFTSKKVFKYVEMINDENDIDKHIAYNYGLFFKSKKECKINTTKEYIKNYEKEIKDYKDKIKRAEKRIKELEMWVEK